MQTSFIAIGGKGQTREQIVKVGKCFRGNDRGAERELRALRTQHPTRKGIYPAVRLTIDTFAAAVFSSRSNRKGQTEERMPSVVDCDCLEIIRIM